MNFTPLLFFIYTMYSHTKRQVLVGGLFLFKSGRTVKVAPCGIVACIIDRKDSHRLQRLINRLNLLLLTQYLAKSENICYTYDKFSVVISKTDIKI